MSEASLERVDWQWSYDVEAPTERSAEWWARAVFEDAPTALRWFVLLGWIAVLRLRLGPRTADGYILGWRIESNATDRFVLGVESAMLSARLVVTTTPVNAIHATLLRYDRRRARWTWPAIAWLHKLIIRYLMNRAARR